MPTSRISAGILAGLGSGIQRGGQAFAMGDQAFEQGRDQALNLQSQLAQRLAATRLAQAQADEKQQEVAFRAPEALRNNALIASGIPVDAAPDAEQFVRTGKVGAQYDALPADQAGPALPRPEWEAKLGPFARQLAATQNALAIGDKSSSSIAKALETNREMSLGDKIIAGQIDPMKVSQSQFALKGSAPFHFSEYGVGNNLTGAVDASGAPAQLFAKNRQAEIQAREAQAGASRASAASSYASADNSRASAARTRSEMERGMKSGDIVVQQAADGTIMLVNKLNGIARPATAADGVTVMGKGAAGKDIPATASGKIIEGRQALNNIDSAIAALKKNPGAVGISNAVPGAQTVKQLWASPDDIGTRAQVANIGSLVLHDRSGAAVSVSEFPRLAPFIPSPSDTAETATRKLTEMRRIAEDELGLYAEAYSPENGYRPTTINKPRVATPAAPAAGGFKYLGKE
jgi:hypothetical protein